MDYQKQAEDFLKKHGATITIKKSENQAPAPWSKPEERSGLRYNVTITRAGYSYSFPFWDSIKNRESAENAEKLIKREEVTFKPYFSKAFIIYSQNGFYYGKGPISDIDARKIAKQLIEDYKAGKFEPNAYSILACIEKYDPGTFAEFCADFGYNEDSRIAERIFLDCIDQYKNVERLFGDCMDELAEIN